MLVPTLYDPTPAIQAVASLLSARAYVSRRFDGAHGEISMAMWKVLDELGGEESRFAIMLVKIDNERERRDFSAVCASGW